MKNLCKKDLCLLWWKLICNTDMHNNGYIFYKHKLVPIQYKKGVYVHARPTKKRVRPLGRACVHGTTLSTVGKRNVDLRLNWIRVLSIAPFGLGGFSCTMAQNWVWQQTVEELLRWGQAAASWAACCQYLSGSANSACSRMLLLLMPAPLWN